MVSVRTWKVSGKAPPLVLSVLICFLHCQLSLADNGVDESGIRPKQHSEIGRKLNGFEVLSDTTKHDPPAAERKIAMIKVQLDASEIRQLEKDIQHQLAKVGKAKTALSSLHVEPLLAKVDQEFGKGSVAKHQDVSEAKLMHFALSQDERRQSRFQEELQRSKAAEKVENAEWGEMHKQHTAAVARALAAEEAKEKVAKREELKREEQVTEHDRKEAVPGLGDRGGGSAEARGLGIRSHGQEEAAAWEAVQAKEKRFEAGLKELRDGVVASGRGREHAGHGSASVDSSVSAPASHPRGAATAKSAGNSAVQSK